MIAICNECWNEYSVKRKKLGYKTCLDCGEANAKIEVARRSKCVAPAFNKGAYQYIGTIDDAKNIGK